MFWLGLFIKYGLPLMIKLGVFTKAEGALIDGWYWAKKNVKTYAKPEDFPHPPPGENQEPGTTNINLRIISLKDDQYPVQVKSGM